jgi:hypothetical protein
LRPGGLVAIVTHGLFLESSEADGTISVIPAARR